MTGKGVNPIFDVDERRVPASPVPLMRLDGTPWIIWQSMGLRASRSRCIEIGQQSYCRTIRKEEVIPSLRTVLTE